MPLLMGDWIRGTRGMRAEVKGVYIGLLIHQYDEGFIPADLEEIALIEPEVKKVWDKLKDKFEESGPGQLQNKKLEEVREFWDKQFDNGKRGGRPKKKNPNNNPNANPNNNLHNDLDIDIENKKLKGVVLPFDTPDFKTAWETWLAYRVEIKKPYKSEKSQQAQLVEFSKYDERTAIAMIHQSIKNSWQGIFELKTPLNQNETGQQNPGNQNSRHAAAMAVGQNALSRLAEIERNNHNATSG